MNKNSKGRAEQHREECRRNKHWPTKGFKKKAKPFPKVPWANQ